MLRGSSNMRIRRPHRLKENKRSSFPHRLLFFDTETIEEDHKVYKVHKLRLGVACFVRLERIDKIKTEKWKVIKAKEEFYEFIEQCTNEKEVLYCFAHNIDFDASVLSLYDEMQKRNYVCTKWFVHNQGLYMKFRKGKKSIIFSDSFMLFPMPLRELGKFAGLEKYEMPESNADENSWIEYCKRDVEILKVAFLKYLRFLHENDLGNFQITIGAQAFNAFRHRFMSEEIYVHGNAEIDKIEEESYFGGRCEAYFIGHVNRRLYYLDVVSMYPFVMRNYFYPTKFLFELSNITIDELKFLLKRFCLIAHVLVSTKESLVPYRSTKVIFPVGKFWGWYTTGELKLLLEHSAIEKIDRVLVYKRAMIFRDYVDFFYEMKKKAKQEKDNFSYLMAKLFLNALYGKFGQRVRELKEVDDNEVSVHDVENPIISTSGRKIDYIVFGGRIWKVNEREPSFNSFIAISSHVTGYARAYLYRIMKFIGRNHVYYCDTDSVFVDEEGFVKAKRLINENKLGALGIKGIYPQLTILGAKAYLTQDERRIKGIPARARQIDDNTFEFDQFMRFRTKLRKNMLNCQVVVKATRTLSRVYDKGQVLPNGSVIPFEVVEGR